MKENELPNPNVNEDVIRKIQKLLSKGNSSEFEAERNLCLAKAQELLAQYNLDMAMVQDAVVAGGTNAPLVEKREKSQMSRSAMYRWQRDLWEALANANFCWWSVTECKETRWKRVCWVKRHTILGKESNVLTVRLIGEYLCDTIERLLPYESTQRMSRLAISWRVGFAEQLVERINHDAEKRKKKSQRDAGKGSTALIVLSDLYNTEYEQNYDFEYGPGAYKRKLIADEQWEKQQAENIARRKQEALKAEREWLKYLQTETAEQKQAREKEEAREARKEERRRERRSYSWGRARRAEVPRVNWDAYEAGQNAGKKVNLSTQVKETTIRRLK